MVGPMIREWRLQRRMTQAQLAEDAEVSTRHLSCLETGKSRPSREMLLVLCSALDMPLRRRNHVLKTAGFVPAYSEGEFGGPDLAPVVQGLQYLLDRMEPYGAVVVDSGWDVRLWNRPMEALSMWLTGRPLERGNLLRSTFDPNGLRPWIENWEDVAIHTLNSLHRDALHSGSKRVASLRDELAAMEGVPPWKHRVHTESVLLPLTLAKDGVRLSFFTTLATVGTAADVTLSELRIESYFPADDSTQQMLSMIVST